MIANRNYCLHPILQDVNRHFEIHHVMIASWYQTLVDSTYLSLGVVCLKIASQPAKTPEVNPFDSIMRGHGFQVSWTTIINREELKVGARTAHHKKEG